MANRRYSIDPIPVTTGTNVRTIGMKRARMTALPPCCAKNCSARSRYSFLNNLESSRSKRRRPYLRPIAYPVASPVIAATKQTSNSSEMSRYPCEARNPAVNRRLSPGRKNPTSKPVSAKIIANMPTYPTVRIKLSRSTPGSMKISCIVKRESYASIMRRTLKTIVPGRGGSRQPRMPFGVIRCTDVARLALRATIPDTMANTTGMDVPRSVDGGDKT